MPPDLIVQPEPFPHVVLDGWFEDSILAAVWDEFPSADDPRWIRYGGDAEAGKLEGSNPAMWGRMTSAVIGELSLPSWRRRLAKAFGTGPLVADTTGGGYHQIEPNGRLAMHADFNRGPNDTYRRLNCLTYLNPGWQPSWGGALHLDDEVIAPIFGRTVIFATSDCSWHGHPEPWKGPVPRRSIAVYYFSAEPPEDVGPDHSTIWQPGT